MRLLPPWLTFDLGQPMRVLSFAPHNGGYRTARRILWRQVRNADLTPELDVPDWLRGELRRIGAEDAVCFLTSRKIAAHVVRQATVDDVRATAIVTAGLGNAERIGTRQPRTWKEWGTINVALRLSQPLSDIALVEAITLVAEARTLAVLDARIDLPGGHATGTGTDCIAVAAPPGTRPFAGKHTAVGHALGRAAHDATAAAIHDWLRESAAW
ncbi:adenosylcobinamide amidohydrolase [Salipiger aestuarii]|uniref:Adenosylcobinamide hydrolase n=1 Tax=Salipiger aestuarii TaxID=568098 RepID=A0A327Y1I6_9RHOB|nr:adenosylcobinamide amidohydrolase [Salipiger aestuarii]EIE52017.1 hypothetical protein C357_06047 [Citreicella sp. 357]KAA8606369.1 adenosylcobinamide amidohydrolase [Salipiger aestuarii]KAB2541613.1 adenosylcobinamide amidohydrolase [Salipiger aestuarii]RAK14873.1 adenosylcobinamide hydrolase [Salipiger aestuarii]